MVMMKTVTSVAPLRVSIWGALGMGAALCAGARGACEHLTITPLRPVAEMSQSSSLAAAVGDAPEHAEPEQSPAKAKSAGVCPFFPCCLDRFEQGHIFLFLRSHGASASCCFF